MFFFLYTISPGACTRVFKAALAFQLHKNPLMLACGNEDDGTHVLDLAGWDGAWDTLDQTGQPKGHLPKEAAGVTFPASR